MRWFRLSEKSKPIPSFDNNLKSTSDLEGNHWAFDVRVDSVAVVAEKHGLTIYDASYFGWLRLGADLDFDKQLRQLVEKNAQSCRL